MLVLILKIALLLGAIIIPLMPNRKTKKSAPIIVDMDTKDANYAVNENGSLEKINKHSLTDH